MNKIIAFKELCKIAFIVAITATTMQLWPILHRLNTTSHQLLDCTWWDSKENRLRSNPACLQSQLLAFSGSAKSISGTIAKSLPEITGSIEKSSSKFEVLADNSVSASKETVALARSGVVMLATTNSVMTEVHNIVVELQVSVKSLTADADVLLKSSDVTVQEAGATIAKLGTLMYTLNRTAVDDTPKLEATLKAMQDLLEDESITNTLANIDKGTKNLADTAETFNIATVGLRKRVGLVKMLLSKTFEAVIHLLPLLK